jgi:energy-coupling factor transport system ATP-binding protein
VVAGCAAEGTAVVIAEHRGERVRPLADRILSVRDGHLRAPEPEASAAPPEARPAGRVRLRLEGIDAGYPGRPVLADAHLELHGGRVVALRGHNGSGKTLLARVACGLHRPGAGRVLLDGRDVTGVPAERRFPAVALVAQDPGRHLLTERVGDELEYALVRLGIGRWERRRRVAHALGELGLEELADRHPLELSVGQRERVALAAILVARPGVIVLDEPTRGMDPVRKADLAALLRARAADGAAVLVTTHDAAFARMAADRTVDIASIARAG